MEVLNLFFIFAFSFGYCHAVYKRWQLNTNFENPHNWDAKRVPCGNDVVVIPDDSPIVYMQLNTTIKELVLPRDGELILGSNVRLGFTSEPDGSCPDAHGDVHFTAVHPQPWLGPAGWCASATERGKCDSPQSRLDVEQVPCVYDDVVFPRDRAYLVSLAETLPGTTVKTLKVAGSSFTTTSFATFINSTDGQLMFKTSPGSPGGVVVEGQGLTITREACSDIGGCACGNDRPEIAKLICGHVENTCRRPRCGQALQATGGCCRMCGVIFNITKDYGFHFADFESILKKEFFNSTSDVSAIVSVMTGDWIQIVLSDTTGTKSIGLAKDIERAFKEDYQSGGHKYAIHDFTVERSFAARPLPALHSGTPMSGSSIAGIVFGVIIGIIIIAVLVVIFVYRRTGRPLPAMPPMPRLPTLPRSLPNLPRFIPNFYRASTNRGGPSVPQTAAHVDPGFANPMYDNAPYDDDFVMKEMDFIGSIAEQPTFDRGGFNNPLYGKSGLAAFSDPSKADCSGDEATSSGIAATPTSGASPGPVATPTVGKKGQASASAPSGPATGIILDFGTDVSGGDSTI